MMWPFFVQQPLKILEPRRLSSCITAYFYLPLPLCIENGVVVDLGQENEFLGLHQINICSQVL